MGVDTTVASNWKHSKRVAHTQLSDQKMHTRTRIPNVSTHVVSDPFMKILLGLRDVPLKGRLYRLHDMLLSVLALH